MGRPPKPINGEKPGRPKPTPEQIERGRQIMLAAIGSASWALVAELLIVLVRRKVLTDKAARKVMRGALDCIDTMHEIAPDPAFEAASETIAGQLDGWKKGGKLWE